MQRITVKHNSLALLTITFLLMLILNPITVYAALNPTQEAAVNSAVDSFVNSKGTGSGAGNDIIQNGVSYNNTGYLCYMLTKDGGPVPGTNAKAFKSPGYCGISGSKWIDYPADRKGYYTVSGWEPGKTAPWNVTPWNAGSDGSVSTNEPSIKSWLKTKGDPNYPNTPNAAIFVANYFGKDVAQKLMSDEYILVIETIMNFQYSKPATGSSTTQLTDAEIQTLRDHIV